LTTDYDNKIRLKKNMENNASPYSTPKRRAVVDATVVSKGGYASLLTQQAGLTPKLCKVRLRQPFAQLGLYEI
jgi:hypothetical protein